MNLGNMDTDAPVSSKNRYLLPKTHAVMVGQVFDIASTALAFSSAEA